MGPLSTCGRRYGPSLTQARLSGAAGQFSVSQARSVMARCRAFRSWSKSASVLVRIRVYGLPARKV